MKTAKKLFALLLVVSLLAGMLAIGASAEGGAQIVSQQLSLGDDLTMRFDVAVDSQYQDSSVICVETAGTSASYTVSEMTAGDNGNYQVYVKLAAAQMNDNIAVTVSAGETVLAEGNYSVRKYCQYLLDNDYTDATKQMAKELLNYGAKAQTYFVYDAENLANAGNEIETTAEIPTKGYDMTVEGQVAGIACYGTSLLFKNRIAIRYYFTAPNGIGGYTFTANGTAYEASENQDGLYYVEVPGINPQEMDKAVELTVSNGTDNLVIGYSPMSYMVRMSAKESSSANLKALLKAMYSYHLAAKAFLGVEVNDNRPVLPVYIIDGAVSGTWADAKVGSASLGPQNSYDGDFATNWNPAITDFMSDEGIIYTLDSTYDLSNITLTTHRIYYFNIYGSADGVKYEQILRVGSSNAADYYTGEVGSYVCDISLKAENVKYLQIVFTGCVNIDATHVSVYEVELSGKKPAPASDGRVELDSVIISHAIEGKWANDREGTSGSAAKTYDGNATTNWNPAVTNFQSGEAIVYTLDRLTELTNVTLTFGSRLHYFDLSVSADGESYTHIARVNATSAGNYFDGLVATIDNAGILAKYIRIDFLGTENKTTWVSLMEVAVAGKKPVLVDDGTAYNSIIIANSVEGTWVDAHLGDSKVGPEKSYDGNATTNWNPRATNYKSGEAIVYTLDSLINLNTVTLTFGSREYYFNLSVSVDGKNFTKIAQVDSNTAAWYFDGLVATVPVCMNARYIRLDFLGSNSSDNTTYISLMEIAATGKAPVIADDGRETVDYSILANSVEGTWVDAHIGDSKVGPEMSYDDSLTSIWNPRATNFKSGEAIVYTLDKAYDMEAVAITFGSREYYFDLSVSGDSLNYTHVARVNAANASRYFNGLTANINVGISGVRYVKLSFLGSANDTTFVAVADVQFTCKAYVADTTNSVAATIVGNEVVGTWVKSHVGSASAGPERSYDGSTTTNWNPQATNFKSGEGIIYTLDKAYDLTEISLTFGTRLHYFDLYVSADGVTYLPVASITAANAAEYFDGLVATVDNLTYTGVVYIKVMFTGTESGTTFINLFESAAEGK